MNTKRFSIVTLLFFAVTVLANGGEATVALTGIPSSLSLPAPAGTNLLVTATIAGGETESCWLARTDAPQIRIMLTKIGDNTYQVNLGDSATGQALSAGGSGSFCVWVKLKNGGEVRSISISFRGRAPGEKATRELYLITAGGGREKLEICEWMPTWFNADAASQLIFVTTAGGFEAKARIGSREFPFVPDADGKTYALAFDEQVLTSLRGTGEMRLMCKKDEQWEALSGSLRAIPASLDLKQQSAKFTVYQRSLAWIPGAKDYYCLSLGDITAGQVLISISTADDKRVLERQSLRQGGTVNLTIGKVEYEILLSEMVNMLIGNDYAIFEIARKGFFLNRRVEKVIERVRNTDLTIFRDDAKIEAGKLAEEIERTWKSKKDQIETYEQFVKKVLELEVKTGGITVERVAQDRQPFSSWLGQ